ncbi:MAG: tyrosine-type recombinase/integrase [Sphingomonadales bacterium]|jgi:integrase|nr:tyrosine-type recombinase/integrase [Sphingomonadales bacterium]
MITKRIVAPPRRLQEAATALAVSAGEKGDEDGGGDFAILSEDTLAQDIAALFVGADIGLIDAALRAWEVNSRRAFISDVRVWARWCRLQGRGLVHVDAHMVSGFLRALSGTDVSPIGERSAATIERYLVSIGNLYRLAGMEDPTDDALVRLEHKAARKKLGTYQRQALALRFKGDIDDLDSPPTGLSVVALLKACGLDRSKRERALRDEVLLRVAVDTGCRRSELVAIEIQHVEGPNDKGAGRLFIPRSKNDTEGQGAYAYLSPKTMEAIAAWMRRVGISRGALLRRVRYHPGKDQGFDCVGSGPLHPDSVSAIYKRLVLAAGEAGVLGEISKQQLDRFVVGVSGHSIRVGVAQDAAAAGESLLALMQAYRWKDPRTVMRYTEKLAVGSGAAARMADRFAD